jgi:hypothetical protein
MVKFIRISSKYTYSLVNMKPADTYTRQVGKGNNLFFKKNDWM